MKKRYCFYFVLLLFILIFFSGAKQLKREDIKISSEIFEVAKQNEEKIKVIVELNDNVIEKNFFGISSLKKLDKNSFISEKKIQKKVKHNFIYSNSFSAELSLEEIEKLSKEPEVKKIYYDYPVQIFLQNSTKILGANESWTFQADGINLTGKGQSVCVIDTGIDYKHNDFGGCERIFSNTSFEQDIDPLTSPNYPNNYPNYNDDCKNTHNISVVNADRMGIYFSELNISSNDYLILTDDRDSLFWSFTNISEFNRSIITPTNKIKLYLCTNSTNGKGYNITRIMAYNLTKNCSKVIDGHDFYNGDFDPLDDHGHGTHVSGIVAANGNIKGVAPEAKIVAVKSLNSAGKGYFSNILAGIEFCINKSDELNISVISMSLGFDCTSCPSCCYDSYCDSEDDLISRIVDLAVSKNISVVIAIGNNGNSTHISKPSCIRNVTRVGSSIKLDDSLSFFSNRWGLEMLVAPGSNINSTKRNGGYEIMSGTSMATPHVSGAIAVIRQYLQMTNRTMTSKEIEAILNLTGKNILQDERIYKRISLKDALLQIDVSPPVLNFSAIENNSKIFERNLTFNYSVEDWQLSNITLILKNSSNEIYFNETKEISGRTNNGFFSVDGIITGNYSWYLKASDLKGNFFSTNIMNFMVLDNFNLILLPSNNTYTKTQEINFFCNVSSRYNLTNITIYLWNSFNELLKNETKIVYGKENFSIMNYSFSKEENYIWGCKVFNEYNEIEFVNHTIKYDVTLPTILSLEVSKTHNSASIFLETNKETNASIEIFGKENKADSSFSLEKTFSFTGLSSSTNYFFNVTFCDRAGNCNFSGGSFRTNDSPSSGGRSSSSGGGRGMISQSNNQKREIFLSYWEIFMGVSEEISKEQELKFSLGRKNHSLKINSISNNSVSLTIRSDPITFIISVGEEKKLNLSSEDYYDLSIKLNEIKNEKVNLTIREIREEIVNGKKDEKKEVISNVENTKSKNSYENLLYKKFLIFLIYFFIVIFLICIIYRIAKRIKRKDSLEKNEESED